jgi:glucose/arabinose dehydrogenase
MQGILNLNNLLLVSEHGPRGGDEINIVKPNTDYGWPFVTYGKAYGVGDYIKPKNNGTHAGYEEPIKYWVPSIAPTELVQIPKNWGNWSNQIAMGTLKEETLVLLRMDSNNKITEEKRIKVKERIRDLDTNANEIIATTDSGKILVFKYKK